MLFAFFMMSCNNENLEEQPLGPKSDCNNITEFDAAEISSDFLSKEYLKELNNPNFIDKASFQIKDDQVEKVIPIIGKEGENNLYIVKNTIGFTIVSGLKNTSIIFGSSLFGTFDENNITPAFKIWLENASKFIDQAREAECKDNEILSHKDGEVIKLSVVPLPPDILNTYPIANVKVNYKWGQRSPFNRKVPNGWTVGCGPLAIGMIIKYNEYANNNLPYRNWDKIHIETFATSQEDIDYRAEYLNFIRTGCKAVSNNDQFKSSGTTPTNCLAFLQSVGYTNAEIIDFSSKNTDKFYDELKKGYALMCVGYNEDSGHAYVAQGLRNILDYDTWSLQHYINWGHKGDKNGWFQNFGDYNTNSKFIMNLHQ